MNLFHSISVTSPLRLPPKIHRSLNTPASKRKLISLTSSRLLRKSAHCQQSWQKDQSCLLPPDSLTAVVAPCVCSSTTSLILASLDPPLSFSLAASIPDPDKRTASDGLLHVHPRLLHFACGENPPCSKNSSQASGSTSCFHGPPWTTTFRTTLSLNAGTAALRMLATAVRSSVCTRVTVTLSIGSA